MPALGSPMVRHARRMAAAYGTFPGDRIATPAEEILAWHDARQLEPEPALAAGAGEGAIGRRELLRRGALAGAGAAALALAGPRSASAAPALDDARVVVVGAGLAGLTATYRLRTHGIHAVVHEAQERLGGRCYWIRGFFSHGQTAEHGGQYIDSRHRHIRALADELHVRLVDTWMQSVPEGEQRFRWYDGAFRTEDEVFADYGTFYERLERAYQRIGSYRWDEAGPEAVAFDNMTVTEWLDRRAPGGASGLLGIWCSVFMASFFGVDADEASAIEPARGAREALSRRRRALPGGGRQRPGRARARARAARRRHPTWERARGGLDPLRRHHRAQVLRPRARRRRRPRDLRAAVHDAPRRRPHGPRPHGPPPPRDRRSRDGDQREAQRAVHAAVRLARLERRVLERPPALGHVGLDMGAGRPEPSPPGAHRSTTAGPTARATPCPRPTRRHPPPWSMPRSRISRWA